MKSILALILVILFLQGCSSKVNEENWKKVGEVRLRDESLTISIADEKNWEGTYPGFLINTLSIQEAKDSSAVENIITTHDDIYKPEVKSG